jgi:uncharacterized protein (DUF885 family)
MPAPRPTPLLRAARAALTRVALTLGAATVPAAQLPAQGAGAPKGRETLQRVLDDHWRWYLAEHPVLATRLGVRAHERTLGDLTLAAMDRRARAAEAFVARLDRLDSSRLAPGERVTRAVVRRTLAEQVEGNRFGQRAVLFTTYYGWHTGFADLGDQHPFRDRADWEAYVARLADFPRYNRGALETTRAAIAGGFAQPCAPMAGYERTIAGAVASPPDSSRWMQPFRRRPPYLAEAEFAGLRARALAAVRDSVYPAYAALLAFYRTEYAPRCRQVAGISATPGGAAYYAHRVRAETTTELTPQQVHELGLREVARIGAAMDSLARQAGFADRAAYVERLRTDPRYYARTPDELLAAASVLAKRIDGELPRLFGRLPRLPYTVRPVPAAIAPGTTTAYYERGSIEGATPGIYRVNTSKLDQRPLYELPSLTAHEAVPGHHLQIAVAQELDLPLVRRHGTSFAAFTEGWALYAETLGQGMGLYDTPETAMGRLSYEMWRATRLVVDPGMHALGWTPERAVAYMLEHTALSRGNVEAEVNRYATWPGQATAYKVGELRMRELRARAEARLGTRFDLRAFHDAVLANGPVPLDVLSAEVEGWIARAERGAGRALR